MSLAFVLTPQAEQDINDIWEYIATDSLDAADRVLNDIENAFEDLSRNPGHWPLPRRTRR